jgi:hypothetical protein
MNKLHELIANSKTLAVLNPELKQRFGINSAGFKIIKTRFAHHVYVLIQDEKYTPSMDDVDNDTSWHKIVTKHNFSNNHLMLISDLQFLHDNQHTESWPEKLIDLAMANNLNADFILLEYVK